MAPSLSTAKTLSSLIAAHSSAIVRRGYASASQGGVSEAAVRGSVVTMMKKGGEDSTKSTAWVPDPVTGYYKPEGHGNQIDAAELRELLLKQKTRRD
ncbi:unnamed protein product [Lactuca virosa]|uniref:Uncharacterized protein n=1 Tax=Lactuca virosa TaxID=75947 RepID=A0AAU9N5U6_9ASTR|nr:unnamed protein product [Lactuca virosa]